MPAFELSFQSNCDPTKRGTEIFTSYFNRMESSTLAGRNWLRYLYIDTQRIKERNYFLILLGMFVLFVAIAFVEGLQIGLGGDFTVFWYAGQNFSNGNDLYSRIGGAERYIYPPFAAMLFQALAIFPLKVAAVIYTFVNLLLYVYIINIVHRIFLYYKMNNSRALQFSLLFAFLLAFRFFWYHLMFIQMNEIVLALCLSGVLLFLKKRETLAIVCFVIATFIKIIPIFFLFWIFFRGNFRLYLKGVLVAIVCVILPWIWRGLNAGVVDLKNYYITFLEPFQQGRVEPNFQNYSLGAAIYKISLPMKDGQGYDYNFLHLTEQVAKQIYGYSFLVIFVLFLGSLAYLRWKSKPISISEIALILLATHLLSGITWEYHLVSFLYVYMALLNTRRSGATLMRQFIFLGLIVLAGLNAIVGRDTFGVAGYHYFGGYGILTWMMVLLYFYFLYETLFPGVEPIDN